MAVAFTDEEWMVAALKEGRLLPGPVSRIGSSGDDGAREGNLGREDWLGGGGVWREDWLGSGGVWRGDSGSGTPSWMK